MNEPIIYANIRSIIVMNPIDLLMSITFVYMSKYMCLWFYFLNKFKQSFATCMLFSNGKVKYTIRWSVSDKHINIIRYGTPQFLTLILAVHKTPVKKLRGIWRAEYSDSFNLNHVMLQISTNFFQFVDFLFCVQWAIFMFKIFQFLFVSLLIQSKIMIACYDNLMFVGDHFEKLTESFQLVSS